MATVNIMPLHSLCYEGMSFNFNIREGSISVKGNEILFTLPPYEYFKATVLLDMLENPRISCIASLSESLRFLSDSEAFIMMYRYLAAGGYCIELKRGDFSYYV